MEIYLYRKIFTDKSTIGDLYIGKDWTCFTLEDVVREGPKVPGKTAIPAGRYEVTIDMSSRFKRMMPHILNVTGFDGIRIHPGNKAEDTEGCILVGLTKDVDFIGKSKAAYEFLFARLEEGLKAGKCFITIG